MSSFLRIRIDSYSVFRIPSSVKCIAHDISILFNHLIFKGIKAVASAALFYQTPQHDLSAKPIDNKGYMWYKWIFKRNKRFEPRGD